MSREDVHKLLGGYATGTLTDEEQRLLFEAALLDQDLFDALAREQALRDLLGDPAARAQLLAAVEDVPAPWYRRLWRPVPMAALATALMVVTVVAVWQGSRTERPVRLAKFQPPPVPRVDEGAIAPVLPPPPELARAVPAANAPYSVPGVAPGLPVPAPPPPPAAAIALAKDEKVVVTAGSVLVDASKKVELLPDRIQAPSSIGNAALPALAFAPRAAAPLYGTVTDATGAAVASATVEVKSIATGDAIKTSTNERGEFSVFQAPASPYQLSASAPGFRTTTLSGGTPVSGAAGPVNLRLEVGSVSESVEVTTGTVARATGGGGSRGGVAGGAVKPKQAVAAEARQQTAQPQFQAQSQSQSQSQQPGGIAQGAAASGAVVSPLLPTLSMQYHVFSRTTRGELVEIGADGIVAAGATLVLRVIPSDDGYLRISRSNGREIANRAMRRSQQFDTRLPPFGKGQVQLQVAFSRQPFQTKAAKRDDAIATKGQDSAGAVASVDAAAQSVQVTITLHIR